MKRVCIVLGCAGALLLAGVITAFAAEIKVKNYTVTTELKGSSVAVECKIVPLSEDPVKKLHFEARRVGSGKIADVMLSANGTAVPVKVTMKEHDWAGKHVSYYVIDQDLPVPVTDGQELILTYVVSDIAAEGYLQIPLFVPSWKLDQEDIAFNGSLKLPSGSYFQGKSLPISYMTEESGGGLTVLFRNLNVPTGLYASIAKEKAGFFTWGANWTIIMFVLILVITFFYLRYELEQTKGRASR